MTAEEFGAGMIQPLLNAEALTLSCSTKDPFGKRHDERRWRRRTRTFGVSQYRIQVYFLQDSMAPTSPCTWEGVGIVRVVWLQGSTESVDGRQRRIEVARDDEGSVALGCRVDQVSDGRCELGRSRDFVGRVVSAQTREASTLLSAMFKICRCSRLMS